MSEEGPEDPRLESIYEKLEKIDPSTFEKRVGELLSGLGFSQTMMARCTKDMSGGWRMRVALAQVCALLHTHCCVSHCIYECRRSRYIARTH